MFLKAIILAAGVGERLGELTELTPKPMIIIDGKPILHHNIDLCVQHGVTDVYINLHHLPHVILGYFGTGQFFGTRIFYSHEEHLLGTAGGVRQIYDQLFAAEERDDMFFVLYGDNYHKFDLSKLIAKYEETGGSHVIGFHRRDDVEHSGVAEFDDDGRITKFIEKPRDGQTESHWVNAGVYLLNPSIIPHIPFGVADFALDVFPALLKKNIAVYGVCEDVVVQAFDTPEMYAQNKPRSRRYVPELKTDSEFDLP